MLSAYKLTFGNSIYLLLLLLALPLGFLFYWAEEQKKKLLTKVVALRLRPFLVGGVSVLKRWVRFLFLLMAFVFLVLTLAQPQLGYEEREVKSQGRDVILIIDVSRSMLATDITPTRLGRAQLLGQDLLDLLPGDRIGLVAFAGKGFLEAPLTLDHSAIRDALTELDMNLIPIGGTNIAEALEVAITAFGKSEGGDRSIILLTDGEELEASGVTVAKEAAARNIKIFTIGIGSAEGSLIPIKNELGENDFVRDEHGKPVLSKLDVARLQEIAKVTGGFYEPFGADAIHAIVEKGILPLTTSNTSTLNIRRPQERYAWPLAAALFFLTLWCLSNERRRKKEVGFLFLLFGLFSSLGHAATGLSAYSQGDYANALHAFEEQIQSGSASEALRFDAGTAAYKQQDYKKAETYFTQAMTSSSKQIQQAATYNLANTLVRQGEAAQKKGEKLANWNNALQHYETVLKADPHNKAAQENRDIVKKMIEKLKEEKEEEPPKNQPQHSPQDQKNKEDQKKQEKNEQNKSQSQQPQDQQKENSPSSSNGNGSSPNADKNPDPKQPSQDQSKTQPQDGSSSNPQDQQESPESSSKGENNDKPSSSPNKENTPSGGSQENKKQQGSSSQNPSSSQQQPSKSTPSPSSEKKQGNLNGGAQGQQEEAAAATEKEDENNMSRSQAEAILRSVEDEERRVPFQQQQQQNSEEPTRDW